MTQQAIDFVVKTFALAFASIITLMGMTIFLVALFQGDGEAQRIVNDLTTPFLGVLGSLVAAFLGHWFFVIRQGASASGTPNSAFNSPVAQLSRYEAQQWAASAQVAPSYPPGAHGPLVDRVNAIRGASDAQGDPGPQSPQTGGPANGH